jgi:hypothetical protein
VRASAVVARDAGAAPGSIENLLRGRLKFADRIEGKIHAWLARRIEQEIAALEQELSVLRGSGGGPSLAEIDAAQAALDVARAAIGRARTQV